MRVFALQRHGRSSEQPLERLPELLAHATVDEEVQRVAEEDEKVGEKAGYLKEKKRNKINNSFRFRRRFIYITHTYQQLFPLTIRLSAAEETKWRSNVVCES